MRHESGLIQTWALASLLSVMPIAAAAAGVATVHASDHMAATRPIVKFIVRCDKSDFLDPSMSVVPDVDFIAPYATRVKTAENNKAIEEIHARAFVVGGTNSAATATVNKIRFLGTDTAVADGKFKISGIMTRSHQALPPETGNYTAIVKKSPGHWRIVSIREVVSLNKC